MSISKVRWNLCITICLYRIIGRKDSIYHRVALWRSCNINRCMSKYYLSFRHTNSFNRECTAGSYLYSLRISISNILACAYHNSSGNECNTLSTVKHFGQIINSGIWITATHGFYESRDNIIMIISILIISYSSSLNTFFCDFQSDLYLSIFTAFCRKNTKFNCI